ncbi:MAG: hypothetical protein HYT03_00140 [Candidatus Harrisonbacteria bacterium]|nr:hypothetical protein [Candidatus Harrisonbacteria bacterium]
MVEEKKSVSSPPPMANTESGRKARKVAVGIFIISALGIIMILITGWNPSLSAAEPAPSAVVSNQTEEYEDLGVLGDFASFPVPEGRHKLSIVLHRCDSGRVMIPAGHNVKITGVHVDVKNATGKKILEIRSGRHKNSGSDAANSELRFCGIGIAVVYVWPS